MNNFNIDKKILLVLALALLLRIFALGSNPPSLYWDEVSLGYNAYSILTDGIDEHGNKLPITNFPAFGDYKPPLYIYLTVPSIFIFGLTEFAVRLPSALFGVLTVYIAYLLAKKFFKSNRAILFAPLLLSVSPWHIQLSRGAFEGNVALFFSTFGIFLFLKFVENKPIYLVLSAISFLLAMYTFTGQRLFVPLIVIILGLKYFTELRRNFKITFITLLISLLLFYPLFNFSRTLEGKLRFEEVTIFKDLDPINESTSYIEADEHSTVSKILHNRRLFFAREFLMNYFDAFDPAFLFAHGDGNPRLSVRYLGELYYFELPLLISGAYFLIKNKNTFRFLILTWLLISPLGPATARETPHALRMIHILPTFQLIAAYGLANIFKILPFKKFAMVIFSIVLFLSIFFYLHMYHFHYPKEFSGEWQFGYKEAVEISSDYYEKVDKIVVTEKLGRPYIYFLFYNKISPEEYLKTADIVKDDFFFYHVDGFGKYTFTNNIDGFRNEPKTLFIAPHNELPSDANKIHTINDLGNFKVFDVGISDE